MNTKKIKSIEELESIARRIRGRVVSMSHNSRVPHLGSSLSCVDILVSCYWSAMNIDPQKPNAPNRDRLIVSKGHAAPALYATLAARGYCPDECLNTIAQIGSKLEEHPSLNCLPGVEASTGSLGHGLPIGVGMALTSHISKTPYRVFVILGDGECNEGTIWEAAMFAAKNKLSNMMVIVDFNKWQATGRSCDVMELEPFAKKWEAFGWSSYEIDGHNMGELVKIMDNFPDGFNKPIAVIANTVKGKGISFMEDDNNWHYRIPSEEEVEIAKKELRLI